MSASPSFCCGHRLYQRRDDGSLSYYALEGDPRAVEKPNYFRRRVSLTSLLTDKSSGLGSARW
jgi:hypothetical protein